MNVDDIRQKASSSNKAMQLAEMLTYVKDEIALESPAAAMCISIAIAELEKAGDRRQGVLLQ